MNPIALQQDLRPHHGHQNVFINPDEVSSIHANQGSTDNPTVVVLKNGTRYQVEDYPDDVAKKLFP